MSQIIINKYYQELERIKRFSGATNESSLEIAFINLLSSFAEKYNLQLIPKYPLKTSSGKTIIPDGTIKNHLRLDEGWWESKDSKDDLDIEIQKKVQIDKYPTENIIFEDTQTAILIQNGKEIERIDIQNDSTGLERLLSNFFEYKRQPIKDFINAIQKFEEDLPEIIQILRLLIKTQSKNNQEFIDARHVFLEICREGINPEIILEDVNEMIIQHILTADIFTQIFYESEFHFQNSIAKSISIVLNTFFTGDLKRNTFAKIDHYYSIIRKRATEISNHHDKQHFLKQIYESFYHGHNPLAADRLGIVYTPGEIVRFIIQSCDHILDSFFGKLLTSNEVKILDPCTGTGTFITELIDYLPSKALKQKYNNDIYANEIGILPYYIANLNIEYTYQQKIGDYCQFNNLALADTLSSCGQEHKQYNLLAITKENTQILIRENNEDISVILGNPPYNARQEDENQSNKNRTYQDIDVQIKSTYLKLSSATKTNVYDPYVRFIRWASDRLSKKGGIIAYVINSSFLHKISFDGFRKSISKEFDYIYIIDLGGDIRVNPQLSGTKHNVFGIQTGVAIIFLIRCPKPIKSAPKKGIYLSNFSTDETAKKKKNFLERNNFASIDFEKINWTKKFTDVVTKKEIQFISIESSSKPNESFEGIFNNLSNGLLTCRDDWIYGDSQEFVKEKVNCLIDMFNDTQESVPLISGDKRKKIDPATLNSNIKWSRSLKKFFLSSSSNKLFFDSKNIRQTIYRPFTPRFVYFEKQLNECQYGLGKCFPSDNFINPAIYLTVPGDQTSFSALGINTLPDRHVFGTSTQVAPMNWKNISGKMCSNISKYSIKKFSEISNTKISDEQIFYYTYAILNCKEYIKEFEEYLSKMLPQIPIFPRVEKWVELGNILFYEHINWNKNKENWKICQNLDSINENCERNNQNKFKIDKSKMQILWGKIIIINAINPVIFNFKLGRKSAIEWVLDQAYPSKSRYAFINENFPNQKDWKHPKIILSNILKVYKTSIKTEEIRNKISNLWKDDFT